MICILFLLLFPAYSFIKLDHVEYLEIEAVHLQERGELQTVHAVIKLSQVPLKEVVLSKNLPWYVPKQISYPKVGFVETFGWFQINNPDEFNQISTIVTPKAAINGSLDVTSILQLNRHDLQQFFFHNDQIGAFVYQQKVPSSSIERTSTTSSRTHLIKSSKLAAYVHTEAPRGTTSVYWLLPAIGSARTSAARLHDSSLLMYYGTPRLVVL